MRPTTIQPGSVWCGELHTEPQYIEKNAKMATDSAMVPPSMIFIYIPRAVAALGDLSRKDMENGAAGGAFPPDVPIAASWAVWSERVSEGRRASFSGIVVV